MKERTSTASKVVTCVFVVLCIFWMIPIFEVLINSFKLFDQNMALTGGAPEMMLAGGKVKMTELLALNIFSTYNINKNWHGVAQAKAVVFFILVAILAIAQQSATRSKEVQQ